MIKLICVGKIKEKYLSELILDYSKRINKYHKFEIILEGYPKNGETPNSIILEYSDKIDPNFKGEIVVIRRDL